MSFPHPSARSLGFAAGWALSLALCWEPLRNLTLLSLHDDRGSYLLLIPLLSAILIYLGRDRIFSEVRYSPRAGAALLLPGILLFGSIAARALDPGANYRLSLLVFALLLCWTGAFVLFYGVRCSRAALFPLCFLLLMIPLPGTLLERAVYVLQKGSADISYALFRVIGMPVFREGFRFSLPGINIVVAEECSGFRSSISLLIFSLLIGHYAIPRTWRKLCFTALTVPIVIFKNALRIVTLSWLAVYVNPEFLYGKLHHQYGGLVFSLVALTIMALLLFLLRKGTDPGVPSNRPSTPESLPDTLLSRSAEPTSR